MTNATLVFVKSTKNYHVYSQSTEDKLLPDNGLVYLSKNALGEQPPKLLVVNLTAI